MDATKLDFTQRLGEVLQRTQPKLGPGAREQLAAIINPQALAIVAAVLLGWLVSHAFGVGEAVDIILGVFGVFSIGMAVFSGLDEFYEFASGTYRARSEPDLEAAAGHLARAIAILGIETVLALLFKGRPKGGRVNVGPEPPRTPGWRYKPATDMYANLPRGVRGRTNAWGDIKITNAATAMDRDVALLHEKVHRFLTAKFYPLRRFRIENRFGSYFNTSLYRYFEEALAQTIAMVGRAGFMRVFEGIGFPVKNGYVYLLRGGGYGAVMKGRGLLPEAAGLLAAGIVQGFAYELWFAPGETPSP